MFTDFWNWAEVSIKKLRGKNRFINDHPPQHVAIIMDGNRRYATTNGMKPIQGHILGFKKLRTVVDWCIELEIPELSIYAFAIANFKRSAEEVRWLMTIFKKMFEEMYQQREMLAEIGLCIQVVGSWDLIPEPVRHIMSKVMLTTRHNTKMRLNMDIAYSSQAEITTAAKHIEVGVQEGDILIQDISSQLLNGILYLIPSRPVDLLIRTSGEVRLSDYMLWETRYATLVFTKCFWPEFSYKDFINSIQEYYDNYDTIHMYSQNNRRASLIHDLMINRRTEKFITKFQNSRWKELEKEISDSNVIVPPAGMFMEHFNNNIWIR